MKLLPFDDKQHIEYIKQQIDIVKQVKEIKKNNKFCRKLTMLKKYINIRFCIFYYRNTDKMFFYIVGTDLIQILKDIPFENIEYGQRKKTQCGTNHARFYNYECNEENMIRIATELRMLENYISARKSTIITRKYIEPIYSTGILGINIAVDT